MHGGNYLVRGSKCALTLHQRRVDSSGLLDAIDESSQMTRGYRGVKGPRVRRWSYALFQVLPLCLGARVGTNYSFLWYVVALKSSDATLHTSFYLSSNTCKMRLVRVLGGSALLGGTVALFAAPSAWAMRRRQGLQSAAPAPSAQSESWHDSLHMLYHASKVIDEKKGASSPSPQSPTPLSYTLPACAQRLAPSHRHRESHYESVEKALAQPKPTVESNEAAEQELGCSARAKRTRRGKSVNHAQDNSDESWSGENECPEQSKRIKKKILSPAEKAKKNEVSSRSKKGLPSIREQEWMLQKFVPEAKVCINFLDQDQVVREKETLGELVARFSVQHAPHLVSQKEIDY